MAYKAPQQITPQQLAKRQANFNQITNEVIKNTFSNLPLERKKKFVNILVDRFKQQPELTDCEPNSVIRAFTELTLSNVEPTVSHAVFIVRNNKEKNGKNCDLQWTAEGKKRSINVATNGNYYVLSETICENDKIQYGGFPKKILSHDYDLNNRGEIIGAYACLMRAEDDTQRLMIQMSKEEIEHIRDTYSESMVTKKWNVGEKKYDIIEKSDSQKLDTVWYKEFSEMCIKTVIGRLHKRIKANINTYSNVVDKISYIPDENTNYALDVDFNITNTPDEAMEIDIKEDLSIPDEVVGNIEEEIKKQQELMK